MLMASASQTHGIRTMLVCRVSAYAESCTTKRDGPGETVRMTMG